mmetsp:Transcript_16168/g.31266  ORF Transcript_16168/g.31266 Transcript_16168/m.31266 type:complete len:221 (+) Transcript_16168:234-896(+)|eukprot:CAMPEP_0171493644 /NCGR_PEP_ID=MMETSP0958-20121227/5077_1 /TAXON_ID=87120 /ORGANISM="Aurantiochytrium limacinum, Strain ATCCMYA-1381" /LENGTH=220 /DNA_ID=CAMNT_0012027291 /DNA_START=219 /DNA_END=881 /DNA_ORIENTATION=+
MSSSSPENNNNNTDESMQAVSNVEIVEDDAEVVQLSLSDLAALAKRMDGVEMNEDEDDDGAESASNSSDVDLDEAALDDAATSGDNIVLLATSGDLATLRALVVSGKCDVNINDDNGYTPLMAAASYGRVEVVKFLLEQDGIEVNKADDEGDTALHYCTTSLECMKLLLEHNGDLSIENEDGFTPLQAMKEELEDEDMLESGKEGERLRAMVEFLEQREA